MWWGTGLPRGAPVCGGTSCVSYGRNARWPHPCARQGQLGPFRHTATRLREAHLSSVLVENETAAVLGEQSPPKSQVCPRPVNVTLSHAGSLQVVSREETGAEEVGPNPVQLGMGEGGLRRHSQTGLRPPRGSLSLPA